MVKMSDNLIADTLLKTLEQAYFQQIGNYCSGTVAPKLILQDQASIDLVKERC